MGLNPCCYIFRFAFISSASGHIHHPVFGILRSRWRVRKRKHGSSGNAQLANVHRLLGKQRHVPAPHGLQEAISASSRSSASAGFFVI